MEVDHLEYLCHQQKSIRSLENEYKHDDQGNPAQNLRQWRYLLSALLDRWIDIVIGWQRGHIGSCRKGRPLWVDNKGRIDEGQRKSEFIQWNKSKNIDPIGGTISFGSVPGELRGSQARYCDVDYFFYSGCVHVDCPVKCQNTIEVSVCIECIKSVGQRSHIALGHTCSADLTC